MAANWRTKLPNFERMTFFDFDHGAIILSEHIGPYKHLMSWPPLTWIFLGPRATFHTWHIWCYSKKPRSLIKAKVELSPFFWKHSLRGVVRMTYLHHFKSEFKFQSWLMGFDKFLIDHPEVWASKVVSWERKKFGSRIGRVREQYLFWPGSNFFSLSTYHFWCLHLWMIDEKLIDTH